MAVGLCVAVSLAVSLDLSPSVRGPISLVFVLFVPGWTAVRGRVRRPLPEIALVVATSVAAITVVAELDDSLRRVEPGERDVHRRGTCAVVLISTIRVDRRDRQEWTRGRARHPGGAHSAPTMSLDAAPGHGTATALLVDTSSTTALALELKFLVAESARPVPAVEDVVDASANPPLPTAELANRRGWWVSVVHVILLGVAIGLWIASVAGARVGAVSGVGLVSEVPATYFVALGVVVVGFALVLAARVVRQWLLLLYTIALVAMLHATTAILYSEPRYAWTYKHLGVIDYIAVHGRVDRSVDIYHSWPGFFVMNVWFSRMSGWAPIDYAAWAQVAFEAANVAALVFCFRGITRDARRIWAAVWIFLLANWLGQDYLSPQAFGFFVGLVITGLVLRCAPCRWPPTTRCRAALVARSRSARHQIARTRFQRPPLRGTGQAGGRPRAGCGVLRCCRRVASTQPLRHRGECARPGRAPRSASRVAALRDGSDGALVARRDRFCLCVASFQSLQFRGPGACASRRFRRRVHCPVSRSMTRRDSERCCACSWRRRSARCCAVAATVSTSS